MGHTQERDGDEPASPAAIHSEKHTALNYLKRQAIKQEVMGNMAVWMVSDLRHRLNTLEACNPEEIYTTEIIRIVEKTLSSLSPQTRRVFEMRRMTPCR
jgi:RNA polymerase sigma-70 factor (ECF subfamily)